jgi:outer membrane protein assembly factor BamD (BamD/ComL family)
VEPISAVDGADRATAIPTTVGPPPVAVRQDEDAGFQWTDLEPENVAKGVMSLAGYGPDEEIARRLYGEGEAFYQQKRYKEAAAKFKSAAHRWPDSILEEDALFMRGESYFFADNYSKAHDTFGNLLKKYDNSRHLDTVVLREFSIGRYWDQAHQAAPHWPITPNLSDSSRPRFDTLGNAIKAYETVAIEDPTGPLADDSLMALGNARFVNGQYEDAARYYDRLRKEYPNSPHQVQAHLLAIKSKEMIYQGPMYDVTPLEEAAEVADTALAQFGNQLGAERDKVAAMRGKIDAKLAERDWGMAQFYETKKQIGAARYYYHEIIKKYPGSEMARASQARLEQLKDEPAKPPNRFKWLTGLFPEEE